MGVEMRKKRSFWQRNREKVSLGTKTLAWPEFQFTAEQDKNLEMGMTTIENALWNQILKALLYPIKQLDLYFVGNSKHTEVLKQVRTWYIFFQEITVNSMEDKLKAQKNGCFQTVLLEKALESPLDCKEIKSVNPKGNQSWIFIGRTDTEAETPILWSPDAKSQLTGKSPDAKKDWRQTEKRGSRGWDGCMGSLTQGTWVCASSRR